MTREEAIKLLHVEKSLIVEVDGNKGAEQMLQAYDMAIEALSADAVRREKYDTVCEEYNRLVHGAICRNMCDENCKYEKGNTCYHAREHYAIDSVLSADAVSRKDTVTLNSPISIQAEMVAVVRCKDCRYSRVYQTDSKGTMQTHCVAFVMSRTVTDDDFCSWGERREK